MDKRIFIAISLPDEMKNILAGFISQAKKINPHQAIHYVKPAGLHLTLHFLGNRNEREIKLIEEIIKTTCRQHSPMSLITSKINAFPDLKNPTTIILEVKEKFGSELTKLQATLGKKLTTSGISLDDRPWKPHLTVARIKTKTIFKTQNLRTPNLEFKINHIELMHSQLHPQGSQYKIIKSFTLNPSQ
ncbi:MAG: RNA 2',3'-cyclic phosphodiesterase [Patescibacteria group bacterium]|jgi:2'-5' RNA ligase|nr:RNA 2',3'-cyclic phosphodiesterase [Patescibacteria group bacterium]